MSKLGRGQVVFPTVTRWPQKLLEISREKDLSPFDTVSKRRGTAVTKSILCAETEEELGRIFLC